VAADLDRAGLSADGPRILERPIEAAGTARFEIVDFSQAELGEGHFFAIRHATPQLLWKPALLDHPNGVLSLDSLTIAVADPAECAPRLSRFIGSVPASRSDGLELSLKAGLIRIVDPGWIKTHLRGATPEPPYIAGIGLGAADIGKAAELF